MLDIAACTPKLACAVEGRGSYLESVSMTRDEDRGGQGDALLVVE